MTPTQFVNNYNGKAVDVDKVASVQCVDLFKAFTKENYGIWQYTCGNGYASGLWINRKSKPYYKYFVDANVNSLQNGDWCIWGNCSFAPNSHIAMYYNGKLFGQNQNGKKQATLISLSKSGIIGVLRPKMYVSQPSQPNRKNYVNLPPTVDSWRFYRLSSQPIKINAIGKLNPKKYGGLSYYVYSFRDNGATAEIETVQFGRVKIYIKNTPAIITIGNYKYKNGKH